MMVYLTLPGNHLEKLEGNRKGQYSIRINDQWRVCFRWQDKDALDVEIVDYHQEVVMERIPPIHPGEILLEDYLKPPGISQTRLAIAMRVPANRIFEIVQGKRVITADTALRLELVTGTSARFWLNLQANYDLRMARFQIGDQLQREIEPIHPRKS